MQKRMISLNGLRNVLATCILGSSFIFAALLGSNRNIKNWLTKESKRDTLCICRQSCTPIASTHCIIAMAFAHGPMRFVLRKTADLHTQCANMHVCVCAMGAGDCRWVYTPCTCNLIGSVLLTRRYFYILTPVCRFR